MKPTRLLLLSLALAALPACTAWKVTETPAPRPQGEHVIRRARVTPAQSGIVVLRDVQVTGDSIIGWHPLPTGRRQWVMLHRDEVRVFEQRGVSTLSRVLFAAALGGVAYLVWLSKNTDW